MAQEGRGRWSQRLQLPRDTRGLSGYAGVCALVAGAFLVYGGAAHLGEGIRRVFEDEAERVRAVGDGGGGLPSPVSTPSEYTQRPSPVSTPSEYIERGMLDDGVVLAGFDPSMLFTEWSWLTDSLAWRAVVEPVLVAFDVGKRHVAQVWEQSTAPWTQREIMEQTLLAGVGEYSSAGGRQAPYSESDHVKNLFIDQAAFMEAPGGVEGGLNQMMDDIRSGNEAMPVVLSGFLDEYRQDLEEQYVPEDRWGDVQRRQEGDSEIWSFPAGEFSSTPDGWAAERIDSRWFVSRDGSDWEVRQRVSTRLQKSLFSFEKRVEEVTARPGYLRVEPVRGGRQPGDREITWRREEDGAETLIVTKWLGDHGPRRFTLRDHPDTGQSLHVSRP